MSNSPDAGRRHPAPSPPEIPEITETRAAAVTPLATYWPSERSALDDGLRNQLIAFAEFGIAHYLFILQNGVYCRPAVLPAGIPPARQRECFKNAASLALEHKDLTYVEGFGSSIIPIHHAWCVDRDGAVVDPTWKEPESRSYFGVPLQTRFVAKRARDGGAWGVFSELFPKDLLEIPLAMMVAEAFLPEVSARPASARLAALGRLSGVR